MKKKTILCIDDIATNLLVIESVLDELAEDQYNMISAMSAKEGIEQLSETDVDIILLDVMMPEIDGFECARLIKSNPDTKDIPIIFVTANKDDDTIEKCYSVGGDDYINKPFNHTELLARINFHLKSKEQDIMLQHEKEYIQSILDLQDNIILVADSEKIINVNKALLNFFNVNKLEELREKTDCISENFIEDDGYFSLKVVEDKSQWVEEALAYSQKKDLLVKMLRNQKEYTFTVKITNFDSQYIMSLTDITQISQQSLEYKHEASYDSLTEIYNRHMLNRLMTIRMAKAKDKYTPLSFIIFDIDHFKNVNDEHGHLVGDEVLKQLAKLVKLRTRENDLFARWGGEEFVLVLDVSLSRAKEIANNLRKHIEETDFHLPQKITCSFGVAEYRVEDTIETLIDRADHALYEAKNSGRNKVCEA